MNEEIEVPPEIKRWNWGAFLLCPFWCLRHGIWQGFLLAVPFFGFLVPFWLGATGNQKAWMKNKDSDLKAFLKRQKYWSIAGVTVFAVALFGGLGSLSYSLNYSDGMKMGLEIANSNKRLTECFGEIQKSSFFNGTYKYIASPKPSTLKVAFEATGTKNQGKITFKWEKRGEDWIATRVTAVDSEGKARQLIESPTIRSSFSLEEPYERALLENTLARMIQEKKGHVILTRSEENNDFIQSAIEPLDNGDVAFDLVYSDGYTQWNKKIYQSKDLIRNKDEVINLFTLYASGSDAHVHLIKWNKLTSIKLLEEPSAFFIFGEPADDKEIQY